MTTLKRTREYALVPGKPGTPATPPRYEYLPDPPPPPPLLFSPLGAGDTSKLPFFGMEEGTLTTNLTSFNGVPGHYVIFYPKDPNQPMQVVRL